MNHDYPTDLTVSLRLELHRVTSQRDAFQAALHKEVLDVIAAACSGSAEVLALRAEVARLKLELETA